MSSIDVSSESAAGPPATKADEVKLEVVVVPVSDVDRAKRFYEMLGWRLDADLAVDDTYRVVQFTPPGSGCSIIFGDGVTSAPPGSAEGLQLTVYDLDRTRADLVERGVDVSEPFHDVTGVFHHGGTGGRVSGAAPDHADYGSFAAFTDPDGNGWLLQQIKARLPGRVTGATFASTSDLEHALVRAETAHGEHEQRTGVADPDWPRWYARYMVAEQTGEELPS